MKDHGAMRCDGPLLIVGFGLTGRAVAEYAQSRGLAVCVSDVGPLAEEDRHWLKTQTIPFEENGHSAEFFASAGRAVLSPGVPPALSRLDGLRERNCPIQAEIEFALEHCLPCRIIAVTGTNGKSSTVEVIAAILSFSGIRHWMAGNIGMPLIGLIDTIEEDDVLVLEVSSYQLEQFHAFRPNVGVLLNLSPDHLARHRTFAAYGEAKAKLLAQQNADDVAVLPRDLANQFEDGCGRRVFFDEIALPADVEAMLLPHERTNLKAAWAACRELIPELDIADLPPDRILNAFRLPHRMERVGFLKGIEVINDSKSTNAGSTIAALRALSSPAVLLLGGRSKRAGYAALVAEIETAALRGVVVFGEAAGEFETLLSSLRGLSLHRAGDLEASIAVGLSLAHEGDVLLFSPACSSFDAFANFEERGNAFKSILRSLPGFATL